jgi:hypothetical protein
VEASSLGAQNAGALIAVALEVLLSKGTTPKLREQDMALWKQEARRDQKFFAREQK